MSTAIANILSDCQDAYSAVMAEFGYPITVNGISTPIQAILGFKVSALDSSALGTFNVVQTRKFTFIVQATDYWKLPAAFKANNTFTLSDGVTNFTFVINIDACPTPMQQFQFEANISGFIKA